MHSSSLLACALGLVSYGYAHHMGSAAPFCAYGGDGITNTGPSVLTGNVAAPLTSIFGLLPTVVNGVTHIGDAISKQVEKDVGITYMNLLSAKSTSISASLGGKTLSPGTYNCGKTATHNGILTLDAKGDPYAQFVIKANALNTGAGATVKLVNSGQPCNVFWQVGASVNIGTNSKTVGNILAHDAITVGLNVSHSGGLYTLNGAIKLNNDKVTVKACVAHPSCAQ